MLSAEHVDRRLGVRRKAPLESSQGLLMVGLQFVDLAAVAALHLGSCLPVLAFER